MDVDRLQRRLDALLGGPSSEGNEVEVLRNGDRFFPVMLDAIASARHSVDFVVYIFRTGPPAEAFAEALAERARAGCRVRLLVDGLGSATIDRALVDRMRQAGVDVRFFRPPLLRSPFAHNHRTHRKVLVIDGCIGFTGGVGIAEQWEGDAQDPDHWRDTQIMVRGPAVAGLRAAFAQGWAETAGAPDDPGEEYPPLPPAGDHTVRVVRGSAMLGWDDIETAWFVMLTSARRRITLQSAYFAPDRDFLHVLVDAARRGVQVQILLPGPNYDKALSRLTSERNYAPLLAGGAEVWRYQPTMLHTKILTIDDRAAMVGSSNYNRRSLDHDEEAACIILGGRAPAQLAADFDADLGRARRVVPAQWGKRSLVQRLGEQSVRPLSRFL
jgi:cardiolipin synthase